METFGEFIKEAHEKYIKQVKQHGASCDDIVIYGGGRYGTALFKTLKRYGISVGAFCVTDTEMEKNPKTKLGLPVYPVSHLLSDGKKHLFLVAHKMPWNQEIVRHLEALGVKEYIDLPKYPGSLMSDMFTRATLEITCQAGCNVNCHYCPQSVFLKKYYSEDRCAEMSLNTFKKCIDKTPADVCIQFVGFSEPFLNKDTIKMILYAHEQKREIQLFTTLVGLSMEGFETIRHIPFTRVVLHLPDSNGYANIPLNSAYIHLLEAVLSAKKADGNPFVNEAKAQSRPPENILRMVNGLFPIGWDVHDRAGNLSNGDTCSAKHIDGRIYCSTSTSLTHNILLPDGTVLLCCMDYGMEHILGNLLTDSYEEILQSPERKRIWKEMNQEQGTPSFLCRRCTSAGKQE